MQFIPTFSTAPFQCVTVTIRPHLLCKQLIPIADIPSHLTLAIHYYIGKSHEMYVEISLKLLGGNLAVLEPDVGFFARAMFIQS